LIIPADRFPSLATCHCLPNGWIGYLASSIDPLGLLSAKALAGLLPARRFGKLDDLLSDLVLEIGRGRMMAAATQFCMTASCSYYLWAGRRTIIP
jgi:hypothetical protein